MKTFLPLLWLAVAVGPASAQVTNADNSQFQTVKVLSSVLPEFPESLYRVFHEGQVRVVISVNEQGKMDEWLFVGYNDRRFADLTVDALKLWTFQPARLAGKPAAVCLTLTFNFEVHGVVVSMVASETLDSWFNSLMKDSSAYRLYGLRELDRIPMPIRAESPIYPRELAERGVSGDVAVTFYIDEQGAVRMPSVDSWEHKQLADFAVNAVKQWSFEPPTRDGRPVMVFVRQVFQFHPRAVVKD